ncbi:hypothetical protein BC830DRAFT_1116966 [Chytriomyces sp. MP71]|nr:hypothetical protein BC830DRAFT_1116966 [Chytriomyces sp. MP71]
MLNLGFPLTLSRVLSAQARVRMGHTAAALRAPVFDASKETWTATVRADASKTPLSTISFVGNLGDGVKVASGDGIAVSNDHTLAATPMSLILIALGGCISINAQLMLSKRNVGLDDVRTTVQGQRRSPKVMALAEAEPWDSIHVHVDLVLARGQSVLDNVVAHIMDASVNKYCPVHKTIAGGVGSMSYSYSVLTK